MNWTDGTTTDLRPAAVMDEADVGRALADALARPSSDRAIEIHPTTADYLAATALLTN